MEYPEKFDHIRPVSIRTPAEVIDAAETTLKDNARSALQESIGRVRAFHAARKPNNKIVELLSGSIVHEKWTPISRVSLYVFGGNAVCPSSILMNVIPTREAGVESLVVTLPPQTDNDGWSRPTILAAYKLLNMTEVWAVGGAQAIALLAHGDENENPEPVDMATGPGDIFVTAAKRLCYSVVGIDAEAGPIEIIILADNTADLVSTAYDLISQAEHNVMTTSVLITDDIDFAATIDRETEDHYEVTMNADRVRETPTDDQSGIMLVDNMNIGIQVADTCTAGYLEIHTKNAQADAERITNTGTISIGRSSPVPLGDYSAGPSHVLPTSGTARHASGLSTHTFLKSVHMIDYNRTALEEVADNMVVLINEERLPAHGEAIRAHFGTFLGPGISDAEKRNN